MVRIEGHEEERPDPKAARRLQVERTILTVMAAGRNCTGTRALHAACPGTRSVLTCRAAQVSHERLPSLASHPKETHSRAR
jgi:hypothetical protein